MQLTEAQKPAYAVLRLARLAKCDRIQPFQAGDEDLVCSRDGFAILSGPGGYRHDPAEIARMRDLAPVGFPK